MDPAVEIHGGVATDEPAGEGRAEGDEDIGSGVELSHVVREIGRDGRGRELKWKKLFLTRTYFQGCVSREFSYRKK